MAPPVALRASQSRGHPRPSPRRPRPRLLPRPTLCCLPDNLPAPWPRPSILLPLPRRRRPLRAGGELASLPGTRQPRGARYQLRQAPAAAIRAPLCIHSPRCQDEAVWFPQRDGAIHQLPPSQAALLDGRFHLGGRVPRLLSGCQALESLYLSEVFRPRCLCVSSPNLRTIGFRDNSIQETELVIEDAPRLVRLLIVPYRSCRNNCVTIRVIRAPKLEILGPLLPVVSKLVSQGISPVSPANSMRTVKIFCSQVFWP